MSSTTFKQVIRIEDCEVDVVLEPCSACGRFPRDVVIFDYGMGSTLKNTQRYKTWVTCPGCSVTVERNHEMAMECLQSTNLPPQKFILYLIRPVLEGWNEHQIKEKNSAG